VGVALASRGDVESGIAAMRRAVELKPGDSEMHSNLIMTLGLHAGTGLTEHYAERRRWQQQHVDPLRLAAPRHCNSPDPARRIRVGYVSADFRQHSAAYAFGPMLLDYDRDAFEVSCYFNSRDEDPLTARLRNGVARWRNITGMADADAAGLVREDGIDILVDLSGHTVGNRFRTQACARAGDGVGRGHGHRSRRNGLHPRRRGADFAWDASLFHRGGRLPAFDSHLPAPGRAAAP
jgi:hypothetical protein